MAPMVRGEKVFPVEVGISVPSRSHPSEFPRSSAPPGRSRYLRKISIHSSEDLDGMRRRITGGARGREQIQSIREPSEEPNEPAKTDRE